eukprot:CAMPEP_0184535060 /NCGR_PEP_ID=MMETSP0198_2-20121128/15684_1 /TAXON_ID=1112570 /ORGANISM="Thraustochytrium sp., Strain LLF1b" /LENGTH=56 /DNA_ID=CAMNT_0026928069 /DNA_START=525 /DNA_END=691 /DNA_ORIENTATION=+
MERSITGSYNGKVLAFHGEQLGRAPRPSPRAKTPVITGTRRRRGCPRTTCTALLMA